MDHVLIESNEKKSYVDIVLYGFISLVITIGVSRFGYGTLIVDLMEVRGFSDIDIGMIGGSNLFGYFLGCLLMAKMSTDKFNIRNLHIAVFMSVLTMLAVYFSETFLLWLVFRFVNGLAGGMAFIMVSVYLVGLLGEAGKIKFAPIVYSGVGVGIVLSSLSISSYVNGLDGALLIQVIICAAFFAFMMLLLKNTSSYGEISNVKKITTKSGRWLLRVLTISYMFEGVGYIIYATYIVPYQAVQNSTIEAIFYNWFILGLGAAIGPLLLSMVASIIKINNAIMLLFICQIASILIAIIFNNNMLHMLSSFLFGMAFMGITAAYIVYVKLKWPDILTATAMITIAYSIGQAVGPVLAGYFNDISGGYKNSIVLSMLFVVLSLAMFGIVSHIKNQEYRI